MINIGVTPLDEKNATGDVRKAVILEALHGPYKQMIEKLGILAVDIIFFGQKEELSASQIFFGEDDKPSAVGKVHPHHHEAGEMELVLCFMKDGRVIVNVVGDGYEHVYPDGVVLAMAIKCTDRIVEQAFGTIRNTPISGNNTD